MKNKHAVFPFTMAALALLCFLFFALCMATYVQPLWSETMILVLPSLILSAVAVSAWKGKLDRRMTEFVTLVLSIILVVVSFIYAIVVSIRTTTTTTQNVKYYPRAYQHIEYGEGVAGVFPEEIPADAEDIAFEYFPGFLQGGERFELSYTTTEDVLSRWKDLLEDKAQWSGSTEEWSRTTNLWRVDGEEAVIYQLYWDGGHNHGELAYVLIDPTCSRITFYFDNW